MIWFVSVSFFAFVVIVHRETPVSRFFDCIVLIFGCSWSDLLDTVVVLFPVFLFLDFLKKCHFKFILIKIDCFLCLLNDSLNHIY